MPHGWSRAKPRKSQVGPTLICKRCKKRVRKVYAVRDLKNGEHGQWCPVCAELINQLYVELPFNDHDPAPEVNAPVAEATVANLTDLQSWRPSPLSPPASPESSQHHP